MKKITTKESNEWNDVVSRLHKELLNYADIKISCESRTIDKNNTSFCSNLMCSQREECLARHN